MTQTLPIAQPLVATRYRWWIVVLFFFSTTINYVDRSLFSNLIPYFEYDLRLEPMDLAGINISFLLAYGFGMIFVGRFVDRVGVRVGLALTFLLWNVASIAHAAIWSIAGFMVIRVLLGLGESGNFPAAIKGVTEWFPRRERALATGWFNCGSNVGAIVTPLLVPIIADRFGWRICFILLGGVGIVWIIFWLRVYRQPEECARVSPAELKLIRSDSPEPEIPLGILKLLEQRQTYAYMAARFFTEAPWWFYLTWMPKLLHDMYGMSSTARAWTIAGIYLVADVGSVVGGWLSAILIRRGWNLNAARKVSLFIPAMGALPVVLIAWLPKESIRGVSILWLVIPIVSLAAGSHQAWSSNVFTVISDILPRRAVATCVGLGTAVGAVGSSLFQIVVAFWFMRTQSYTLPFMLAGSAYLIGLLALHVIVPRLQVASITNNVPKRLRWWHLVVIGTVLMLSLLVAQIYLNRPPYQSFDDYLQKRSMELSAEPVMGPTAQVGWQDAHWVQWKYQDGTSSWDLVTFDRSSRPLVNRLGASATGYRGPTLVGR